MTANVHVAMRVPRMLVLSDICSEDSKQGVVSESLQL